MDKYMYDFEPDFQFGPSIPTTELDIETVCNQKYAEYKKACAARNVNLEAYHGSNPQPKEFADYANSIIDNYIIDPNVCKATKALFWHIAGLITRVYDRKTDKLVNAEAICDVHYRRNRVVNGKKVLAKSQPNLLIEMGLLRITREPSLLKGQVTVYALTPEADDAYNVELTMDTIMVNPITGRVFNPPKHELKNAPPILDYIANRVRGKQLVNLNAMYKQHHEDRKAVKHLIPLDPATLSEADKSLLAKYNADRTALTGITINRPIRCGDLAYVQQAWGYTFCGRLRPRFGGWINLSKRLKHIGLAPITKKEQAFWDYDLRAAQVNVLRRLVQNNNQQLLAEYAANKDLRKQWAAEIGVPVANVKTALISLLFGSKVPSVEQYETVGENTSYSFANAFGDKYAKALEILGPFIREVTQSIDQLINDAPQTYSKGWLTFTNCLGQRYAVRSGDGLTKNHKLAADERRSVAAFLLQAGEQLAIYEILQANPDAEVLAYAYDGLVTDRPLVWEPTEYVKLELQSSNVDANGDLDMIVLNSKVQQVNTMSFFKPNQTNQPETTEYDVYRDYEVTEDGAVLLSEETYQVPANPPAATTGPVKVNRRDINPISGAALVQLASERANPDVAVSGTFKFHLENNLTFDAVSILYKGKLQYAFDVAQLAAHYGQFNKYLITAPLLVTYEDRVYAPLALVIKWFDEASQDWATGRLRRPQLAIFVNIIKTKGYRKQSTSDDIIDQWECEFEQQQEEMQRDIVAKYGEAYGTEAGKLAADRWCANNLRN